MARRYKRRTKKQRKVIIITICCLLFFMSAGYAAMQTNIEINAKGNVIKKVTGGEQLLEMVNLVTTGDGLYKDTYEEGRYFYKGANPNNYITFNNEEWRIISVENDGTLKIIRYKSIGDMVWDSSNSNNWARPADLNTYLNGEYLNSMSNSENIVAHNFSIGGVTFGNNNLAEQINGENETIWNGKVGLITVSEYLRANTNTAQCETFSLNNIYGTTCLTTNWLFSGGDVHTISLNNDSNNQIFSIWLMDFRPTGLIGDLSYIDADFSGTVYPVLYLSSDITLSGEGTKTNPFQIENA